MGAGPRAAVRNRRARGDGRDRPRRLVRPFAVGSAVAADRAMAALARRRAPRLPRVLDRDPRLLRGVRRPARARTPRADRGRRSHPLRRRGGACGGCTGRRAQLGQVGGGADRGAAADRLRRADPDLDGRVQLHRVRAHGRGAWGEPVSARTARDHRRPCRPLRRAGLAPRRDRVRPAVHAAVLSAGAARRGRRAVGDEGLRARGELRDAGAHLARSGPAGASIRCSRCSRSARTRCT